MPICPTVKKNLTTLYTASLGHSSESLEQKGHTILHFVTLFYTLKTTVCGTYTQGFPQFTHSALYSSIASHYIV